MDIRGSKTLYVFTWQLQSFYLVNKKMKSGNLKWNMYKCFPKKVSANSVYRKQNFELIKLNNLWVSSFPNYDYRYKTAEKKLDDIFYLTNNKKMSTNTNICCS